MRSQFSPPTNVDVAQRTVLGLDYRKIVILAATLPIALGLVVVWRDAPLFLRGALAVFVAFMGVALAFGQIEGKSPEVWLWDFLTFGRRSRFLLHRALRGVDRRQAVFADEEASAKANLQLRLPDFLALTADAIGVAMLTGLTIWLYQDGAHRLAIWWGSLTTIVS